MSKYSGIYIQFKSENVEAFKQALSEFESNIKLLQCENGGEGMDKNEMIEQLKKNADALEDLFKRIESENNINSGLDLINLSQEIRALYNQIFLMKYCYPTSSETSEDA